MEQPPCAFWQLWHPGCFYAWQGLWGAILGGILTFSAAFIGGLYLVKTTRQQITAAQSKDELAELRASERLVKAISEQIRFLLIALTSTQVLMSTFLDNFESARDDLTPDARSLFFDPNASSTLNEILTLMKTSDLLEPSATLRLSRDEIKLSLLVPPANRDKILRYVDRLRRIVSDIPAQVKRLPALADGSPWEQLKMEMDSCKMTFSLAMSLARDLVGECDQAAAGLRVP
jgi:hypothetical protein